MLQLLDHRKYTGQSHRTGYDVYGLSNTTVNHQFPRDSWGGIVEYLRDLVGQNDALNAQTISDALGLKYGVGVSDNEWDRMRQFTPLSSLRAVRRGAEGQLDHIEFKRMEPGGCSVAVRSVLKKSLEYWSEIVSYPLKALLKVCFDSASTDSEGPRSTMGLVVVTPDDNPIQTANSIHFYVPVLTFSGGHSRENLERYVRPEPCRWRTSHVI